MRGNHGESYSMFQALRDVNRLSPTCCLATLIQIENTGKTMFTQRILGVIIDIIVIASFYYGTVYNMEGLINIGYFTGWLFGIFNLLGFVFIDTAIIRKHSHHRPKFLRSYDIVTDAAFVIFAAYSGWFVLALIFAVGALFKAIKISEIERKDIAKRA